MNKKSVLFLCIHNSARSQMAEAYLSKFGAEHFIAESAGLEPGNLNPLAVEALQEDGKHRYKTQASKRLEKV